MNSNVFTKNYQAPPVNTEEVLRYMGGTYLAKAPAPEVLSLVEAALDEVSGLLHYKVCYRSFEINPSQQDRESSADLEATASEPSALDLTFMVCHSKDLAKVLSGCHSLMVFGATIGIEIDRLIAKYSRLSPSRALCLQAIGAERVEALCNVFCRDMAQGLRSQGLFLGPRFSPGYGDLDLSSQTEIFKALDCPAKIGLSLNQSLLMSPSKSVTALMGISRKEPCQKGESSPDYKGCQSCTSTNCTFRRNCND